MCCPLNRRFLKYIAVRTNLIFEDPQLHYHVENFRAYISDLMQELNKGIGKEIVAKR